MHKELIHKDTTWQQLRKKARKNLSKRLHVGHSSSARCNRMTWVQLWSHYSIEQFVFLFIFQTIISETNKITQNLENLIFSRYKSECAPESKLHQIYLIDRIFRSLAESLHCLSAFYSSILSSFYWQQSQACYTRHGCICHMSQIRNDISLPIRYSLSLDSFKRHFKTFHTPITLPPGATWQLSSSQI